MHKHCYQPPPEGEQITHFGKAWHGMYPDIQCVETEFLGDMECTSTSSDHSIKVLRSDRKPAESDADVEGKLTVEMPEDIGGNTAHVYWDSLPAQQLCHAFWPAN